LKIYGFYETSAPESRVKQKTLLLTVFCGDSEVEKSLWKKAKTIKP